MASGSSLVSERGHDARTIHLRDHTPETLLRVLPGLGLSPMLARRLVNRLVAEDSDELMSVPGLPRRLGEELLRRGRLDRLTLRERLGSRVDPFVKFAFEAADGAIFEAVRLPLEQPRYSVCVSSQVGCALGCAFCETGALGFRRNLEPWEIVDQVLTVRRLSPERPVTGVVFQGQGEALLNYDNVLQAIAVLRHPCGGKIGADRITISTVGLPEQIARYTDEGHPYRLILSLTSAFDERRRQIIPSARRYDVATLAAAIRRHALRRGQIVHLAWVLLGGINTGPEEAQELARLFAGVRVRVSLIDVSSTGGSFRPPDDRERGHFISALAAHGIGFVRRYSGGSDIQAACGMLAGRLQTQKARSVESL